MRYRKPLLFSLLIIIILVIIYLLGPSPETPVYSSVLPAVPSNIDSLENFIKDNEAQHKLKPNNEARIVWYNDSLKNKTDYVIVYLHGFAACQEEGRPTHVNIAKEFGCNLYLNRFAMHGIDTVQPMINLTPEIYWESAKQALQIGKQLGKKVILMATSTGGTLALKLAADYPNDVYALILMSPNVRIHNGASFLLNNHWGYQIAKMIVGSDTVTSHDTRPIYKQYWYNQYPLYAAVELQELLETTMTKSTFEAVKQPTLLLYYYKNEEQQDSIVSVSKMLEMFDELGSKVKQKQALPDVGDHVMSSYIKSKNLLEVQQAVEKFMQKTLKIEPVNTAPTIQVTF